MKTRAFSLLLGLLIALAPFSATPQVPGMFQPLLLGTTTPVTFVASAVNNLFANGTSHTLTLNCGTTPAPTTAVAYLYSLQVPTTPSATYNSVAMTQTASVVDGTRSLVAFTLANPSTGSNTISISWTGAIDNQVGGQCFAGGVGSVTSVQTAHGTVTATPAVTSSTNSLVASVAYNDNAAATTFTSGTTDYSSTAGNVNSAAGHASGAASVTPTWSATERLIVGFSVN